VSFASYILKKINHVPEEDVPQGVTQEPRGLIRITKSGKPDKRSLARGKPKTRSRVSRGVRSYERIALLDAFERAKPGDKFIWDWRTKATYSDIKLRTAQLTYVYKTAWIYGHKVSLSARPGYMVIKYVGSNA
jgi:hypothetical protein